MKRPFKISQSKSVQSLLLVAFVATVSACGQKGPLYLPDEQKQQTQKAEQKTDSEPSSERTKQNNKDKN